MSQFYNFKSKPLCCLRIKTALGFCFWGEEDEHLEYLDALREIGQTNMFGAGSYLREEFGMDRKESSAILSYWMETFSDRHLN